MAECYDGGTCRYAEDLESLLERAHDLGEELSIRQMEIDRLKSELATEQGLRLAIERAALGIDDAGRARTNDAKAILADALRRHKTEPTPLGIIRLARQVAATLGGWSRVIGRRDQALKEAHAARREAELGRQQLQEFMMADVDNLKLLSLDHTGLVIAQDKSYAMRLQFWALYQVVKDAENYVQQEVSLPESELRVGGERLRYFLTVVKPGGKSPHELRQAAEDKLAAAEEAAFEAGYRAGLDDGGDPDHPSPFDEDAMEDAMALWIHRKNHPNAEFIPRDHKEAQTR